MKTIIAALFLISSLSALAQQTSEFRHSVNCQPFENGIDSKISNLQKVSEDKKSVSFSFELTFGLCETIDTDPATIIIQKRFIEISRYGASLPGLKTHARVSHEKISDSKVLVTMTFNKTVINQSRRYNFSFWGTSSIGFRWVAKVEKAKDESTLSFEGYLPAY